MSGWCSFKYCIHFACIDKSRHESWTIYLFNGYSVNKDGDLPLQWLQWCCYHMTTKAGMLCALCTSPVQQVLCWKCNGLSIYITENNHTGWGDSSSFIATLSFMENAKDEGWCTQLHKQTALSYLVAITIPHRMTDEPSSFLQGLYSLVPRSPTSSCHLQYECREEPGKTSLLHH